MLYLGWDIGIKNLAYCIIEVKDNKETIKELNIINLINEDKLCCDFKHNNGNICKGKVEYKDINSKNYCTKHYKEYKNDKSLKLKKIKVKKVKDYSLNEIGLSLFSKLDKNPLFLKCENIIIENQPVLKNPTMKSIQMMLYSYFLIKNKNISNILLVNASNKLKVYKGKLTEEDKILMNNIKDKYKKNKNLSIIHTKYYLSENKEFYDFFMNNKKKDDLADAYLMCKYFINKINNTK